MATVITGDNFGIYVKIADVWNLAVCTSSITVDRTRNVIEFQNNCTGGAVGKQPSTANYSLSCDGQTTLVPGANEVGLIELQELFDDGTISEWKVENEAGTYIQYAESAFIENLSGVFPVGDIASFNFGLAVNGSLLSAEPS